MWVFKYLSIRDLEQRPHNFHVNLQRCVIMHWSTPVLGFAGTGSRRGRRLDNSIALNIPAPENTLAYMYKWVWRLWYFNNINIWTNSLELDLSQRYNIEAIFKNVHGTVIKFGETFTTVRINSKFSNYFYFKKLKMFWYSARSTFILVFI